MPPRSTDVSTRDAVPLAVSIRSLPSRMQEELADAAGVPYQERDAKKLEAAFGERDRTRSLLRRLPPYALLILEAICEARGRIRRDELERTLQERLGDAAPMTRGLEYLSAYGIVLVTGYRPSDFVAVIAPQAGVIAELVLGLSHPSNPPPEPPNAPDVVLRERDVLAAATLTAHRKLKWTRDGSLNKTSLKTFGKGLGLEESFLEGLLLDAYRAGLVEEVEEGSVPLSKALDAAATSGLSWPGASLLSTVDALVPREGWVPLRALEPHLRQYGTSNKGRPTWCAGHFAYREHDGHAFVARQPRRQELTGDGHVTPSFEVLLGPNAHPEVIVAVGLFAELVRIDHVLTFRITEASVVGGLRTGRPLSTFLEALARVGRHEVPDNVVVTVKDFAARAATMRRAWVVDVPEASTAAALKVLGESATAPRPGLLVVDSHLGQEQLAAALKAAGLKPLATAERDEDPTSDVAGRTLLAPPRAPDPELRDAVAKDREAGFAASRKVFDDTRPQLNLTPNDDAEKVLRRAIADMKDGGAPPMTVQAFEKMSRLISGVSEYLRPWVSALPEARAKVAREAMRSPLELVPFACLVEEARQRVLGKAQSWYELTRLAEKALVDGGLDKASVPALEAFHRIAQKGRDTVQDEFEERYLGDGSDEDSDTAPAIRLKPGPKFELHLRQVCDDGSPVLVCTGTRSGKPRDQAVLPVRLVKRGVELVLLATDMKTEEDVAFPLSRIDWVDVDGAVFNADYSEEYAVVAGDEDDFDEDEDDFDEDEDDFDDSLPALPGALTSSGISGVSKAPAGRNDPCPCGSGKKYKRCHGAPN